MGLRRRPGVRYLELLVELELTSFPGIQWCPYLSARSDIESGVVRLSEEAVSTRGTQKGIDYTEHGANADEMEAPLPALESNMSRRCFTVVFTNMETEWLSFS